jgi:hypothetical protein
LSDKTLSEFRLLASYDHAVEWLNAFPPFQRYLPNVRNDVQTSPWKIGQSVQDANGLGIMELPKRNQEVVISAYNRGELSDIDEEVVLSSLVGLLQAITMRNPKIKHDCSNQKKPFEIEFSSKSKLTVKIDGWLLDPSTDDVKALIEAKQTIRSSINTPVSRQESAEVLAFLVSHRPDFNDPVFLISQNDMEIYLIVAIPTRRYVAYMEGRRSVLRDEDFMRMHKFGPWHINKSTELDYFAKIALAIAIGRSV